MTNIAEQLGRKEDEVLSSPCFSNLGIGVRSDDEEKVYVEFDEHGVELQFDNESLLLTTIFLKGKGSESGRVEELMPDNLSFSMSRDQVRERLGSPDKSSKPGQKALLSNLPPPIWDSFLFEGFKLNIQYPPKEDCISLITLMVK